MRSESKGAIYVLSLIMILSIGYLSSYLLRYYIKGKLKLHKKSDSKVRIRKILSLFDIIFLLLEKRSLNEIILIIWEEKQTIVI